MWELLRMTYSDWAWTAIEMRGILILLFIQSTVSLSWDTLDEDVGPVVYTNILYRHGIRTITGSWKQDPYNDLRYWPLGYGSLTKEGVQQMHALGKWLGKRYSNLIPDGRYTYKVIYVQSSNVDRCLMSAEVVLASMFPPVGDQRWSSDINWIPIPVHAQNNSKDPVIVQEAPCKKYDDLLDLFYKSEAYMRIVNKYRALYKYLSKNSGGVVRTPGDICTINLSFIIEELYNMTLPSWAGAVYPERLAEPSGVTYSLDTWTKEMKRLKIGPLIDQLITNMELKVTGKLDPPERNISMYSFHDTSIGHLLHGLGMFNNLQPPFGGTILMDLRETVDDYVITFLYKNSTGNPILLTPPNCTTACPLTEFRKIYTPIIPVDWDAECAEPIRPEEHPDYEDGTDSALGEKITKMVNDVIDVIHEVNHN